MVSVATTSPEEDTPIVKVSAGKVQKLALRIRVPQWAKQGTEVKINGRKDEVRLRLPTVLHPCRPRDDEGLAAISYEPRVLAGQHPPADSAPRHHPYLPYVSDPAAILQDAATEVQVAGAIAALRWGRQDQWPTQADEDGQGNEEKTRARAEAGR